MSASTQDLVRAVEAMFRMDIATLRATLQQLQQAAHDHLEWYENLIRTIVCRLPCDPRELAENAHHDCRFGQWYYAEASADLRQQTMFGAMEAEHQRVHAIAGRLLRAAMGGTPIVQAEFDEFVAVSSRLRLELASLRHEVQDILRSSDALTGAYGRAQLLPELREWRELAKRNVQHCCIVFMDLDYLKEINDTHGHTVGDKILAGAVDYVIGHLRPYDKVFRYGGDEFLISLPGIDLMNARHLIERVREGFGQVPFVVSGEGRPIHATASFGLTSLEPAISVEESIDRADKALLMAKAAGRDRVASWDPSVATGTMLKWSSDDDAAA
jgi:diguanylate cyclase (GGDEF)-like protein